MGQTPPAIEDHRTPLAALGIASDLQMHFGQLTPQAFEDCALELGHLMHAAAIYDLGYRTRIRITGRDRVRWLNGMVSNNVRDMAEGSVLYTFVLNAQGRIQGDGHVFRSAEDFLMETDRLQAPRLLNHLNHYIIMDDVVLHELDASETALGLCGPQTIEILESFKAPVPENLRFVPTEIGGVPVTLVRLEDVHVPSFELWFDASHVGTMWKLLSEAGARPAGFAAVDALRIFAGVPQYGVDIFDRHLPQETNQMRALNFSKGCYLGQEIVERIRSRATIHRSLRQFELDGDLPQPGTELYAEGEDKPVGELTSAAHFALPGFTRALALGYVRVEILERKTALRYAGGTAVPLQAPPVLP